MTSYFPDVNTWLALAWDGHVHHQEAANWFGGVLEPSRLIFSRYSQLGFLRLMTNAKVMGDSVVSLEDAFAAYDCFLDDPRIELGREPHGVDRLFREFSGPIAPQPATKAIGDLYLMAFAVATGATLVTFDKAMARALRARRASALLLLGRASGQAQ